MLGDDLHGKMMFEHFDEGVITHCRHQPSLNLCTRIIGMVENTKLRVPTLAVQVKCPIFFLIEVDAPVHQLGNTPRRILHHLFHSCRITQPIPGNHGVVYMLVEIIHQQVRHRCDTSLRLRGVSLFEGRLATQGNLVLTRSRHFERKTHTGYSTADNQKIVFFCHNLYFLVVLVLLGRLGYLALQSAKTLNVEPWME